jgi:hypothetical protein
MLHTNSEFKLTKSSNYGLFVIYAAVAFVVIIAAVLWG